ncbi:MAG: hydroxyisourate hydrolase [Acidimicrobiia bacterium]
MITTHVLDISRGRAAAGISVRLEVRAGQGWRELGSGATDEDGRSRDLASQPIERGTYRLTFDTSGYYQDKGSLYPEVAIIFRVDDPAQHYHLPLLLSPFGYTTYRGS